MADPLEEFGRLLAGLPADAAGGSIELLLQQMAPADARLLRLCAIPHEFDADVLRALEPTLDAEQARRRCEEFALLPVIRPGAAGLAIHDDARRTLFARWLGPPADPEFVAASARLAAYFERIAAEAATGAARETAERRRMFHLIGADPARGFAEFERLFEQGRREFRLGECEGLLLLAREYESVLSPDLRLRLVFHEGALAGERREWERAEGLLRRVLDDPGASPELRVRAGERMGRFHAEQQHWETAIDFYQNALALAEQHGECRDQMPRILHGLGAALRDSDGGDLDQARKRFEESIRWAQAQNDLAGMAMAYNGLGTLHGKLREIPQAIRAYETSLDCLRRAGDRFGAAPVYNNLGAIYRERRDWKTSEGYYRQSLAIKQEAGDTLGQANSLFNLATVLGNQNRSREAVEALEEALRLFKAMRDDHGVVLSQQSLARLRQIRVARSAG